MRVIRGHTDGTLFYMKNRPVLDMLEKKYAENHQNMTNILVILPINDQYFFSVTLLFTATYGKYDQYDQYLYS